MAHKPCPEVDLELETLNCDNEENVVVIDAYRLTEGITTLRINYVDGNDGGPKTLEMPIGKR